MQTIFKVGRLVIVFSGGARNLGEVRNGCKDFVKNFTSRFSCLPFDSGNATAGGFRFRAGNLREKCHCS